jgi:transcription initiation factor TFIID subunit 7
MKLKLKNPGAAANDTPSEPPSADAPTPVSAKPGGGLKIKFKPTPTAPAPEAVVESQNGDAPKAKRKYTKKPKLDEDGNLIPAGKPGPKKRARDESDDYDSPAAKRKPKPTAKSLAMADESDEEDDLAATQPPPQPRPLVNRMPSIKLKIKPKDPHAPPRTGTAILKVKGAGKPPPRPYGVGYDSEAEEAEPDPAIESQFVLRMLPGPDCDLLRKSIEEKTIGKSVSQGGPGVYFRFFDREGRRAMITIQGRFYAATMVELPAVVESLKSWNKKDWVKTADVCQMLLVLGRVQNEDEAKKYPRPSYVDPDSHRFPHGLTPPMRFARKLRFRPRKSYLDVERAEAQMNRLLAEDENADATKFELIDSDDESEEDSSEDEVDEDEEMANAFQEEQIEEIDAGDLEQMLHAGLVDDDEVEISGNGDDLDALFGPPDDTLLGETPTTAHDVAMHALSQNGNIVVETETAASTPAAATSADDDDDDDDADSDEDEVVDEAAAAEEQRQELLRAEIAELQKALAENIEARDRQNNVLFKKRMTTTIEKQKADLAIKQKQLNEEVEE